MHPVPTWSIKPEQIYAEALTWGQALCLLERCVVTFPVNTSSALLGAVGWIAHPCCASHCQSAQADCSRVRSSCDGVFHAVRTCTACLHWNKWYRCFLVDALLEQKPRSGAEPVSHKLPCLWATWIQSFSVLEMFVKSYSWPLASEQVACTLLINRATARAVSEQTKVLWEEDLLQLRGLERGSHAARSVTSPVSKAFCGEASVKAATAPESPRNLWELPLESTKELSLHCTVKLCRAALGPTLLQMVM